MKYCREEIQTEGKRTGSVRTDHLDSLQVLSVGSGVRLAYAIEDAEDAAIYEIETFPVTDGDDVDAEGADRIVVGAHHVVAFTERAR